jgi:hypothetical protein
VGWSFGSRVVDESHTDRVDLVFSQVFREPIDQVLHHCGTLLVFPTVAMEMLGSFVVDPAFKAKDCMPKTRCKWGSLTKKLVLRRYAEQVHGCPAVPPDRLKL